MANKKRDKNVYTKRLKRYKLNRTNLLAIEKILRVYADMHEIKHAGKIQPHDNQKRVHRASVDRYIGVGKYRPFHLSLGWNEIAINYPGIEWIHHEDSVKFMPKSMKKAHYVELAAWPGIKITFTPFTTVLYAQTNYVSGEELRVMKNVVALLEDYISRQPSVKINTLFM